MIGEAIFHDKIIQISLAQEWSHLYIVRRTVESALICAYLIGGSYEDLNDHFFITMVLVDIGFIRISGKPCQYFIIGWFV